jgi:hypothetical protein
MQPINHLFLDLIEYSKFESVYDINNPKTKREIKISEILTTVLKSEKSFDPFMILYFIKEKKEWSDIVNPLFISFLKSLPEESIDNLIIETKKTLN